MSDDPVADLLVRVARQDRAAFQAVYIDASAKLMGVCLRILGTRSEAEDAVQEVFTRVWLRAARFDPEKGRGMTWLIAIARNHCIDRLRTRTEAKGMHQDDDEEAVAAIADSTPGAESRLIAAGEAGRIADCFNRLEADRAAAIRGAYLQGLSYQDLADRHAVPLNTMRTWLRRGLMSLRECMDA
ncbi:MAG: RNA polymerase subunit sigma [Rhodobacteraceae bacterium PARR1]|nr:MAG: RNA polymerase subunit sigma [Rhodobacteraceae bacterium PARR1]